MQVSLVEAAARLNDLVQAAIDGEEVILLNGDRPASLEHLEIVTTLQFHHRDPFDRLLIAQTIAEIS